MTDQAENHRDEAPPGSPSTLFLSQYLIHWQHGDAGEVVMYVTPVVLLPDGSFGLAAPGQIAVRMPPSFFETFQADVARGGHSSPIAVPRQLGQAWRGGER